MDLTRIDELAKCEKKSSASKAVKEEYKNELIKLFEEEGYSTESEKYLYSGLTFCGAKPLFEYYLSLDNENRIDLLNKIFSSGCFKSNERGCAFKICISLLCETINGAADDENFLTLLIQRIPDVAYKKNGDLFPDNSNVVEHYLIKNLDVEKINDIDFELLELPDIAKKQFKELMTTLVDGIYGLKKKEIPKKECFLQWIKGQEELVQQEEVVGDLDNISTAIQLRKLGAQIIKIAEQEDRKNYSLRRGLEEKDQLIAALETSLKVKDSTILNLKDEVNSLNVKIESLMEELEVLDIKTDTLENEKQKMQSVISVYSTDKRDSQTEYLNAIASKLRAEYSDFLDAKDMEMSIGLGENLRYQIEEIFNILEKSGINVKGR